MNTPAQIAFKDITQHLRETDMFMYAGRGEIWNVHPHHIYTKEVRRLNRKLGLWSINKGKHNMNRKSNNHEK